MRLRSANRGNANNTWNVNPSGYVYNNNAWNALRCAPDCALHTEAKGRTQYSCLSERKHKESRPCRKANKAAAMQTTYAPDLL